MKLFLGIDLGSTATKAVVLGADGAIHGRGLTETRAHFEAACARARAEAVADARFLHFEERLVAAGDPRASATAEAARASLRRAQRHARLGRLRHRCLTGNGNARTSAALDCVFDRLAAEAEAPGEGDALASAAARLAEPACVATGAAHEDVMAAFDRALSADEAVAAATPGDEALAAVAPGLPAAHARAAEQAAREPLPIAGQAGTGYGRHRLPFDAKQIRSEILCHGLGAHHAFPGTRTVVDIGGQDTKAIQLDERGLVTSFQMNDRCAAGCGRYLGYVAEELGLPIAELGPLALRATGATRINSTCTVFAGAEIRERLAVGERREDVVAGLHRAIVQRALSLVSRAGGAHPEVTFSGGVARNPAVVRFLGEGIARHYGEIRLNVSADSIFYGAVGAALFAREEARPC